MLQNLCLAIIQIGDDAPSSIYVSMKIKKCNESGYSYIHLKLNDKITQYQLYSNNSNYKKYLTDILRGVFDGILQKNRLRRAKDFVKRVSNIEFIDGVIIQLPLEQDLIRCIESIPWYKDIDGLTAHNQGMLFQNAALHKYFVPCTPLACMYVLRSMCPDIHTKNIAVFGKSNLVGKPITVMLQAAGASVISIDKYNPMQYVLSSMCDGVISAIGVPYHIKPMYLKQDAFFIDIGVRQIKGKLFGDLDEDSKIKTSWYTPHIRGIGPLTIWFLMENLRKSRYLKQINHYFL